MFRIMNIKKRNNKGFTLVELLVTLTVLLIALTLTAELFGMIYKNYAIVEGRWIVQTEVEYIVKAFQTGKSSESLTTANFVDMFYEAGMDSTKTSFECVPELGAITENADGSITFENADTEHIYLFCYKNFFYYLNRAEKTARRYYKTDSIPVQVTFDVAVKAHDIDEITHKEEVVTNASGEAVYDRYLPKGISITVKNVPNPSLGNTVYSLNTSFAFDNMNQGQMINIDGGYFTSDRVAGWTSGNIEYINDLFDTDKESYYKDGVTYNSFQQHANIVKYVSANSYFAQADVGESGGIGTNFNCATRYLMAGSKYETPVVNALRDFRNNVLKGTVVGDFIIEKYYDWSPAVIEAASNSKVLKAVLKAFVVPAAAAAFCISE